ncbi:hypothetical protein [Blastococcus sp. TML/C7B]|uniref:hypothetical protein n=1 Tax=Blastococcus sp. TML/C7B TaxID=2798728 RepID=UPI001F5BC0AD|nr:hypothetical protein [Blastococcus sp. TML/C7B]
MPAPPDGSTPPGEPTPAVASTSGGVELGRVLSLARITAPQALVLTEDLRAALAEGGGAGRPLLTGDGRITLGPAADGPATRPAERFLDDLAALLPDEPVMDVDRAAVRSELAALARAVRALPDGAGAAPPAPARRAAVRDRPAPRPPRRPRSTGRRIGAWLLSLVVLGAAVTAEVVLLGDDITADLDLLMDAGRGGQEPSDEPVPDGLPVATPAPPSAGAVVAVDLRPLGTCTPGATCAVRVLVRLVPSPEQQVVSWVLPGGRPVHGDVDPRAGRQRDRAAAGRPDGGGRRGRAPAAGRRRAHRGHRGARGRRLRPRRPGFLPPGRTRRVRPDGGAEPCRAQHRRRGPGPGAPTAPASSAAPGGAPPSTCSPWSRRAGWCSWGSPTST